MASASKKRPRTGTSGGSSPLKPVAHDSDSETSDSDDDWNASGKGKKPKKKKAKTSGAKSSKKATSDNDAPHSDPEEGKIISPAFNCSLYNLNYNVLTNSWVCTGEVSDNSDSDDQSPRKGGSSSSYSSSESDEEFNDGYDENLMGDDNDKDRLASMTEKEREEELFNRNERREVMRTR